MSHPWMPFYVADYLADTTHLSTVEHGAYLLLIMNYWQHRGLPGDPGRMARICRMSEAEWLAISDTLAELFGPGWSHKRIDAELAKAEALIARRKAAGKAGAEARYGKRMGEADAGGRQTDGQPESHSPSPSPAESDSQTPPSPAVTVAPREDLDDLEKELRQAAGLETDPAIGLKDLSPILGLLDKGYALHRDILPKLRVAKAGGRRPRPRSWRYFVAAIEEGRAANAAIRPKPSTDIVAPVVFVASDDRRWAPLAERYRREHCRDPPTTSGPGGMGRHWPRDWLDGAAG